METTAMAEFLTSIGSVVTQMVTWVGNVASTIVSTPILLFSTGVFAVGAAVGLFRRFLRRG